MLENYVFYHHWYIFYNNNFSSRIIAAFNTFADTWFDEKQSVMRQSTKSTQHPAHSLTECEAVWWCCCFESFWGLLQWDITTSWTYCTLNTVTPLGHQRGTIATSLILRLIRLYSISASKCLTSHQSSCARFPEQQKKTQHTEEGLSGTRTFWRSDYSEIELKLYKSSLCRVIWVKMDDLHYQPNHLIQYANEKSIITWNLGLHILRSLQKLWYKVSANITLDEVGLDWNWEKKSITLDTQYHVSRMTRFLQIPKWVMGSCACPWVHSNPCSTCRYSILLSPESLIQIMYLFNLLCQ